MSTPTLTLKPREERRLLNGHLWVFSNEIQTVDSSAGRGDVVRVSSAAGKLMGVAIYNPNSLIAARLIDREDVPLDGDWFRSRIRRALRLREMLFPGSSTYRLLHSESDGVPGVIVDRFNEVMSVQIAAAGMEARRDLLFDALMEIEGVSGVVERNDHQLRVLEGLPERVGLVRGTADVQQISDGIIRYQMDPLGGQKTGAYLDQRTNRIAMRRFMGAGQVLDLFCNDGGFALHAADAGAERVIAVDSSAAAIRSLQSNCMLNNLAQIQGRENDVFSELHDRRSQGEQFAAVIADPPPFARSKKHIAAARKRYVELFSLAVQVTAPDGVAFLATCSHHITRDTLLEMVREALRKSRRECVILEERGASPDHPVHPAMPETGYLHGVILRVG
ncbi:MAG: class I SAM-dependent rRNA methyltransferase [Chlorobi bacterium]|nr:MAG: Fmu (Sun) domain-containing protein [Chlorobi bacterium OLB7]MBK8910738.1 class I SAM-dependent rRNA methyltransferase [Chlorobiota bacterium]